MKYSYEEKKKRLCTIFAVIFVCIAGFLYLFSSYIRKDFDTENSDGLILESDNSVGGEQSSEEIADISDSGKSDVKASKKVVVYICGAVISEGVYELEAGSRIDDAVNAAGGFAQNAKKSNAYIIYMNGMVSKLSGGAKVQPGCEIVIPTKINRKKSVAETMSIVSSATSMAAMIATIANIMK